MNEPLAQANSQDANEARYKRTLLDFALLYAKEGQRILPLQSLRSPGCCSCGFDSCRSVAKHPRTFNGVKDASNVPSLIREWWHLYPEANIGIATGKGLLVIDIDPQNGGSLEALNALVALPATATVRTGGGGLHLYFSYDPWHRIRNSVSKLAPGIDIRGENGYVVAPPSIHASGNRYRWDQHSGYIQAPAALLELLEAQAPPPLLYNDVSTISTSATTNPTISTSDTTIPTISTSDNAIPTISTSDPSLVKKERPAPATTHALSGRFIPEGKRNSTLVSLAGSLRNQGANEEILFLVLQSMNTGCCQPPLLDAEVRQICKSAAAWTPGENGSVSPRKVMIVKHVASLMEEDLPSPPWAIPSLLPEGVSLLAGKPKMGKSWLALSLAISIAQGHNALGKLSTNQGSVLYLGLEDNEQRICSRMTSLLQEDPPPDALYWAGACPPLTMGGLIDLEAWITSATHPRLVVIDTLARVRAHNGMSSGSVYADDVRHLTQDEILLTEKKGLEEMTFGPPYLPEGES
jgi:Bifunctional DNA primase/polymerase, N-terminal/AAA domain/Primase C terminal 1 (PriCT-1)